MDSQSYEQDAISLGQVLENECSCYQGNTTDSESYFETHFNVPTGKFFTLSKKINLTFSIFSTTKKHTYLFKFFFILLLVVRIVNVSRCYDGGLEKAVRYF